jgi:photosystem II cytochrome c550
MRHQVISLVSAFCLIISLSILGGAPQAHAGSLDPYVLRYLKVNEPIQLDLDHQGNIQTFTGVDISQGKRLFEANCLNCHVGGSTLPNPLVSLALTALKNANPSRDTINSLVDYVRQPMSYDGTEENLLCRQVPESWMDQAEIENLAAFILRAAQEAPGWGTKDF